MFLKQYGINYCIDRHGIVTRINFTGDCLKVMRTDVVPMVKKSLEVDEVVCHEIFIYTERGQCICCPILKSDRCL